MDRILDFFSNVETLRYALALLCVLGFIILCRMVSPNMAYFSGSSKMPKGPRLKDRVNNQ